ncbi:MAG: hypothetical protein IE913_12535 [Halothiobacillus sp.]|nr:hypothetical protein [Halothiobacillus sp.]
MDKKEHPLAAAAQVHADGVLVVLFETAHNGFDVDHQLHAAAENGQIVILHNVSYFQIVKITVRF